MGAGCEEMRRMAFVIHLLSHLLQGAPPWVGGVACMVYWQIARQGCWGHSDGALTERIREEQRRRRVKRRRCRTLGYALVKG